MPTVQIARSLADKLAQVPDKNKMLEDLLFEIPDEALEQFTELADPVTIEVNDLVYALILQISEAFGMTPLGLTVLMQKIFDRTIELQTRFNRYSDQYGR